MIIHVLISYLFQIHLILNSHIFVGLRSSLFVRITPPDYKNVLSYMFLLKNVILMQIL